MSTESLQADEFDATWCESLSLFEGVDSAVVVFEEGMPVYANRAARNLLCHALDDPAAVFDCFVGPDRESLQALIDRAHTAVDQTPVSQVLRLRETACANKVRVNAITLDHRGRSLQVCTLLADTNVDMPARIGAANDNMLARLVNGFPGMAYRSRGVDTDMEFVSDGCHELTGYSASALLPDADVNYRDLIHPDDRGRVWIELHSAIDERRCFQIAYRLLAADQSERWVWEHGVGIYDEAARLTAIEGFIVDITERQRTESRIREGQRSLAELVSNLQGMAYRCSHSREWDMYFVSDGCFQLTGYASSELLYSRKIAYGDLVHPEDRDRAIAEVEQAVQENRPFRVIYRIITATGQEKLVLDQGSRVFSADESVNELEGFITEVDSQFIPPV